MDNQEENFDSSNEEIETTDSSNSEEEASEAVEYTENEKKLYARAKKAEEELKKLKTAPETAKTEVKEKKELSTFDMLALQKANIETEEDLDVVMNWANFNRISVSDALKSDVIQATLSKKAEERKSAKVVNTGAGRRAGGGEISEETLLSQARKGNLPDSEEDLARLALARFKNR